MKPQTNQIKPLSLLLFLLLFLLLLSPARTSAAASEALSLWWQTIVPALLPFFLVSELLLATGAAASAGKALSPLMQPLFRLPGSASLAVLLGFTAGFPSGAAVTASLYQQGLLSREEGERLIAFTNNAGPGFLVSAVAAGILQCPQAALPLALSQYGFNLLFGIVLGRLARKNPQPLAAATIKTIKTNAANTAWLKQAAENAGRNLALIGCLMCLFSVLAALATQLFPQQPLAFALTQALLEMSLGTNALAHAPLPAQLILPALAAELAFGGLCVQAQVMALVSGSGLSAKRYLLCRLLHAGIAFLFMLAWQELFPLTLSVTAKAPQQAALSGTPIILATALGLFWLILCRTAHTIFQHQKGSNI